MTSTTQKLKKFVAEPVKDKPVSEIAGIGEVLGKRLEVKGFDKASKVLGRFLLMRKDKQRFQQWLKDTCNANAKQSADCYQCLKEYCEAFL